jgi:hypothetical protein
MGDRECGIELNGSVANTERFLKLALLNKY